MENNRKIESAARRFLIRRLYQIYTRRGLQIHKIRKIDL